MSKSSKEAIAMVIGLALAAIFMIWLVSGSSACVKVGDEVFFVDDLVSSNYGVVYTHNDIKYKSNDATYVYANDPNSCDEIFPSE